jgi:hypothetical protein
VIDTRYLVIGGLLGCVAQAIAIFVVLREVIR